MILDEYFTSREFLSGIEAGAELTLNNSPSTASMSGIGVTTPTTIIPPAHQLNSTSPFVDSGVGLNVMDKYGRIAEQTSVDNDDDVFIVEDDGMFRLFQIYCNQFSSKPFIFFLQMSQQ